MKWAFRTYRAVQLWNGPQQKAQRIRIERSSSPMAARQLTNQTTTNRITLRLCIHLFVVYGVEERSSISSLSFTKRFLSACLALFNSHCLLPRLSLRACFTVEDCEIVVRFSVTKPTFLVEKKMERTALIVAGTRFFSSTFFCFVILKTGGHYGWREVQRSFVFDRSLLSEMFRVFWSLDQFPSALSGKCPRWYMWIS